MARKEQAWMDEKGKLLQRIQELKAIADEKVGGAATLIHRQTPTYGHNHSVLSLDLNTVTLIYR